MFNLNNTTESQSPNEVILINLAEDLGYTWDKAELESLLERLENIDMFEEDSKNELTLPLSVREYQYLTQIMGYIKNKMAKYNTIYTEITQEVEKRFYQSESRLEAEEILKEFTRRMQPDVTDNNMVQFYGEAISRMESFASRLP